MQNTEIVLASTALSQRLGVEKGHMIETLKAQCFQNPANVSDTQLATFIQVAQSLNLNPLLPGQLYAYPGKNGGIVPMIGPDGVFKLLASNPEIEGWTLKHETQDKEMVCTAIIKHKRLGDISYTAYLSEWRVQSNPNWGSRPRHMLGIRALKHAARQIIHGIPFDIEEREIIEMQEAGHIEPPERAKLPPKAKGAAAMKTVTELAPTAGPETPVSEVVTEEKPAGPKEAEKPTTVAEVVAESRGSAVVEPARATPTHPAVPQPEGWPKRIEGAIKSQKEVEMTVEAARATAEGVIPAKKLPTILLEMDSPEAVDAGLEVEAKGRKLVTFLLNPYTVETLPGVAPHPQDPGEPRWDEMPKGPHVFTLEQWPSLTQPGKTLNVVVAMQPVKESV